MTKIRLIVPAVFVVILTVVFSHGWAEEKTSENDPKLKRWFQNRPEADLNNDGILTETEVRTFRSSARKEKKPENIQQQREEVSTMDASDPRTSSRVVYKRVGERELAVEVDYPDTWKKSDRRPAIVFFQGGGFKNGGTNQFRPQAEYFARRGMVAVRAEYRGMKTDGVLPDKCMEDAISAMRWVRKNAAMLGVDPNRIVSSGGSSGAHLALSVFCLDGFDTSGEDLSVSPKPNAMVLYNPAVDFLSEEKTMRAIGGDKELGEKLSPLRHMNKILPPTLILYGTEDWLKSQEDEFVAKAKRMGAPIEVYLAEGAEHSFFNWSPWLEKTTLRADAFLRSIGYLKDELRIDPPTKERKKKNKEATETTEDSASTEL